MNLKKVVLSIVITSSIVSLIGCGKASNIGYNQLYAGQYRMQDPYAIKNGPTVPPVNIYENITDSTPEPTPSTQPSANPTPTPTVTQTPTPQDNQPQYSDGGYSVVGEFKVDRDALNQWQATGIAVKDSTIFVSAQDQKGLFGTNLTKKGTVIKMNSSSGQDWKNLGKYLLGLYHPMDSEVNGVAIDRGNNLFAVSNKGKIYTLPAPKYNVKSAKIETGALDIVTEGSYIYVAMSGGLKRYNADLTGGAPIGSAINFTGGIGSDGKGNIYGVCGTVIKKINTTDNSVVDLLTVENAIDVAVDGDNNIYVLTSTGIAKYTNLQLVAVFGQDAFINPVSIAVDSNKNVYVADAGNSHKDSKVVKLSASFSVQSEKQIVSTMNEPDVNE